MKLNTFILTFFWGTSLTLAAGSVKGQQVLTKEVTISFKNTNISSALEKISIASGVKFTYNGVIANSKIKVSASVAKKQLGDLLNLTLNNTPYSYEVLDGEIFVKVDEKKLVPAPLILQRILKGKVTDEKGEGLPGVSVVIKGTPRGGISDINGKYQVQVNNNTDILVFSYVGYKSKEFVVGTDTVINVRLEPNPDAPLKEVAVVAYGNQRKISLVGAQSTVDVGELNQPVASVSTLLAGRIAGVIGVQRSGEPGGDGSNIWIRGLATFAGNNTAPLIVVDGVPERGLDNIDALDIQSFTILKDASATAMYGIRGANGVILVQTKRGVAGKPNIAADYYEGYQSFTRIPQMADGVTYMNMANEALTTRGQAPLYSAATIANTANQVDPLLYPDVNWVKAVFRQYAPTRRAHFTVSGGVPSARYYVSSGYEYTAGLLKTSNAAGYDIDDDYGRYNFTSNLNLEVTKTTKIDLGVQGNVGKGTAPSIASSDIFTQAMVVPPVEFPISYPGGFVPGRSANGDQRNPYADLTTRGYSTVFSYALQTNIRLTQDLKFLTPGLTFSTMYSYDATNTVSVNRTKRENTYILDAIHPYNQDGSLNLDQTYTGTGDFLSFASSSGGDYSTYTESSFNYDRAYGKSHVGGLLLFTQDDRSLFPVSDITSSIPYRHRGLATRETYSFEDKYFAEFNAGYDGSENFAPQNRYGFFPAFGVGWLISSEEFFKPLANIVSFLKFRYTNGLVGSSDDGARFGFLTFVSANHTGYTYGLNRNGIAGINVDQYGTDVTWSRAHKQDLGMDLKFFNDKLSLTADVFKEHRTGVLIQRASVPAFAGIATLPYANVGIVDNKGFDATLEDQLRFGKFNLNLRGTITYNKNKDVEDDEPTPAYPWNDHRGQPVLATYGYIAEGLFTSQAEIDASAVPGDKSIVKPGDIKYKDLNGDGVINAYDQTKISDGDVPALEYGLTINASYEHFDIGAAFIGTGRADRYVSGTAIQPFSDNQGVSNAYANITDRWTPQNPSQDVFYPRLAYGDAANANNTQVSSWWVKDISFIRLKTLDFGYTFSKSLFTQLGVKSARVYVMGYNLLTISKFKLWDPELNTGNGTVYPNVKTLTVGISAQF